MASPRGTGLTNLPCSTPYDATTACAATGALPVIIETSSRPWPARLPNGPPAAIVTGAGRGMGRAAALGLAAVGASVVVADVDEGAADDSVAAIKKAGGQAAAVVVDISRVDDVRRMFKAAIAQFGTVDILINNAGIGIPKPLLEYTEEDWDKQLGVNLKGM